MSRPKWIPEFDLDLSVSASGQLELAGCNLVALAKEFGTPLYVYDEAALRRRCRRYRQAFTSYEPGYEILYASKAFLPLAMAELIEQEGLGLDVMSGGELYTALKAGVSPDKIYFNGNNKSPVELAEAIDAGIRGIIVDNLLELERVSAIAKAKQVVQTVLLRINPGVEAHTHEYIKTAKLDSKFGFSLLDNSTIEAVRRVLIDQNLKLLGFHCHIGSQIFSLDSYRAAIDVMLQFAAEVRSQTGFVWKELNLGGGLGVRYVESDDPQPIESLAAQIIATVSTGCQKYSLPKPRLLLEPGRSIVGEAGLTLYTIGACKTIPGIRTYVAVDGGMTDNPRVALYQAKYSAVNASKANSVPDQVVSVAGKCCESGDMLIWDIALADPQPDDVLAVFSTGAYTYSMASNYNRLLRPAVVFCRDGRSKLVVRRQSYEDLLNCEFSLNEG